MSIVTVQNAFEKTCAEHGINQSVVPKAAGQKELLMVLRLRQYASSSVRVFRENHKTLPEQYLACFVEPTSSAGAIEYLQMRLAIIDHLKSLLPKPTGRDLSEEIIVPDSEARLGERRELVPSFLERILNAVRNLRK